jgi:hypothetical protein
VGPVAARVAFSLAKMASRPGAAAWRGDDYRPKLRSSVRHAVVGDPHGPSVLARLLAVVALVVGAGVLSPWTIPARAAECHGVQTLPSGESAAPAVGSGGAAAPGSGAMGESGTSSQASVTAPLHVQVQLFGRGGPPPLPGAPPSPPVQLRPPEGAVIQVVPPDRPEQVLAEQSADAQGQATFELPLGRYWVVVPWREQMAGIPPASGGGAYLPDGQLVFAWTEATVSADAPNEAVLTITTALP